MSLSPIRVFKAGNSKYSRWKWSKEHVKSILLSINLSTFDLEKHRNSMEETHTRLIKQFDTKKKVMKWIRKKLNKDSPLEFRRHVIKNSEIFSCSNMKKREGRRESDLEKSLMKGIKMQIARTKLVTRNMPTAGYDNWIVWLKENKDGKMILELWKPASGDCVVILMSEVISVYCFDETVVLTNSDSEQFVFLTSDPATMKQLQLIFKAASGDIDTATFLAETPSRPSNFSAFISSSTPLKSNPHLAALRSPSNAALPSSELAIDAENHRNSSNILSNHKTEVVQEDNDCDQVVAKRRHSIVRRSQIMMRSPMMESPRTKVHARRRIKARQPSVHRFTLPGVESPDRNDKGGDDNFPPAPVENDETSKKSPKRTRSEVAETSLVTDSLTSDLRPTKRVSPPRTTTMTTLSKSPKRIR